MEWIVETVEYLNPKSIIDMGCGYGVLINYLLTNLQHQFEGADKMPNFPEK